jgi:hypothetical protein
MQQVAAPLMTESAIPRTHFHYYSRFSTVQLDKVRVIKAQQLSEWKQVEMLRAGGFSRYPGFQEEPIDWIDELDRSESTFSLLAAGPDGNWVATMRIQDGRNNMLEVSKYIDINSLLTREHTPAAQFSRLSVKKDPGAIHAMAGLFKAGFLWCKRNNIAAIICATPRWSYPIYQSMSFTSLGASGEFTHNFSSPTPHKTLLLPVGDAPSLWKRDANPMFDQFVELEHPDLIVL